MKQFAFVVAAVLGLAASSAQAEILWRGDFETGDLSQWSQTDSPDPAARLQVVQSPVVQGQHALQVTVQPGDYASSGNRNEVEHQPMVSEGQERWYRWSTLWPADYQSPDTWQLFMQWHHTGCCGNPPLSFYVYGEEVRVITSTSGEVIHKLANLSRGTWHTFVFHVMWASNPDQGFIEVWIDNERALEKTYVATLYPGEQNYMKMGLYRNSAIDFAQTILHDDVIEATSQADVVPAPPAQPPPPPEQPQLPGQPPAAPAPVESPVGQPAPVPVTGSGSSGHRITMATGCGRADIAGGGTAALGLIALLGAAVRRRKR